MSTARIKMRDALAALRWKNLSPEDVASTIAEILIEQLQPLRARIDALEKADAEREFKGVFSTTQTYKKGNSVAHNGSLWIAKADNPGYPGTVGNFWQLACKRGRDARDR